MKVSTILKEKVTLTLSVIPFAPFYDVLQHYPVREMCRSIYF